MLDRLRKWLEQWPGWDGFGPVAVDGLGVLGGGVSLRPGGVTEAAHRVDILGGGVLRLRYRFWLDIKMEKAPGDGLGAEENARKLLGLQDWVNGQSAAGLAPRMGDGEGQEVIRAEEGALQSTDREGLAVYRLVLTVEQEKRYKGEEYGEEDRSKMDGALC